MRIDFLNAGYFKLDGGAMHGIVPKVMWAAKSPPDEHNRCTYATRCMLLRHGGRVVLVDTGMGDKQDAKFRSHFAPHGDDSLAAGLAGLGLAPGDVTDVLLTHLHFDHVGGATRRGPDGRISPVFPNAAYWTNDAHWAWAKAPNAKEAASFLPENLDPLEASGQLDRLPVARGRDYAWTSRISLRPLYGHTEAMMMPLVELDDGSRLAYCADLIPASVHVRAPWIIAYDVRPLDTLAEKKRLVGEAEADDYLLAFEHDPTLGLGRLTRDTRGRVGVREVVGDLDSLRGSV